VIEWAHPLQHRGVDQLSVPRRVHPVHWHPRAVRQDRCGRARHSGVPRM